MTNTFLVLNYLAPVSFRYNYLFLYYLFFIYLEASIGVLEKRLFQFWSPIQQNFKKKKDLIKILGNFPVKHPFWSLSFKYIGKPKDHLPRKIDVHFRCAKESMPKKFQTGIEVCTCNHMLQIKKPELVIYILFLDQRYMCFSMENEKYIKALSDQ